MKRKKGMSYEEKRDKMLKMFHDSQSVFNYDQVEKISVKMGIAFPTVKDILKSLQSDYLVESQKIGAGVFYWSFPSRTMQIYETKITTSQKQISFYETELVRIADELSSGIEGREDTEQRQNIVEELSELKKNKLQMQQQISKYIRFDPQRVALLSTQVLSPEKQNKELKELTNLQTDNIEQIKKHIKKLQPGVKDLQIEQMYEIPADLDYID